MILVLVLGLGLGVGSWFWVWVWVWVSAELDYKKFPIEKSREVDGHKEIGLVFSRLLLTRGLGYEAFTLAEDLTIKEGRAKRFSRGVQHVFEGRSRVEFAKR